MLGASKVCNNASVTELITTFMVKELQPLSTVYSCNLSK